MNSQLTFLSLLLTTLLINFSLAYQCSQTPDIAFLPLLEEDISFLNSNSTLPNLRIHSDFSSIEENTLKEYIENDLLPPIIDYFQSALHVKRPLKSTITVPASQINLCDTPTPKILHSEGVEADLSLLVTTKSDKTSTCAAKAYACRRASSGRPVISKLIINTEFLPLPNGSYSIHERNVNLVMHEILHALGFAEPSFQHFLDENGNKRVNHVRTVKINGEDRTILDVEPLTKRIRKHFGCPSIQGALLENDGGFGTKNYHFERRVFFNEIMSSGLIPDARLSELSLAVLEGSGWYQPDYSFAEPFFFGQGQGCEFYNGANVTANTEEYCVEKSSSIGCAPTGRGKGRCLSDYRSDGYKFFSPRLQYDCANIEAEKTASLKGFEAFGVKAESRCFSGTLSFEKKEQKSTGFCFKFQCKGEDLDTVLEVQIGNKKAICKSQGPIKVEGLSGELNCPDPLAYCNTVGEKFCPKNCMGRGDCVNNKCVCKQGFTGQNCSMRIATTNC